MTFFRCGVCLFPWPCTPRTDTSFVLQLFEILLEVEERGRMKTTVLPEAEEQRLMQEKQRKIELIYSQLQHHDPLWVIHTHHRACRKWFGCNLVSSFLYWATEWAMTFLKCFDVETQEESFFLSCWFQKAKSCLPVSSRSLNMMLHSKSWGSWPLISLHWWAEMLKK